MMQMAKQARRQTPQACPTSSVGCSICPTKMLSLSYKKNSTNLPNPRKPLRSFIHPIDAAVLIIFTMGKILEENGFRVYIYSNDHPPMHVHILKGSSEAKVHLVGTTTEPELLIKDNYGFKSQELTKILKIVEQHYGYIKQRWDETFCQ